MIYEALDKSLRVSINLSPPIGKSKKAFPARWGRPPEATAISTSESRLSFRRLSLRPFGAVIGALGGLGWGGGGWHRIGLRGRPHLGTVAAARGDTLAAVALREFALAARGQSAYVKSQQTAQSCVRSTLVNGVSLAGALP